MYLLFADIDGWYKYLIPFNVRSITLKTGEY